MGDETGRFIRYPRFVSGKIVLLYLLIGGAWILFSDAAVSALVNDHRTLSMIQTIKGWFYICVTALLLYFLIRASIKGYVRAQEKIEQSWRTAQQRADQLSVANKALADFTDSVANNLRTPLWRISGFCDALEDELQEVDRPVVRKYLRAIGDNTRQMNQLINDTLRLSAIESRPLLLETLDLSAIAGRVAEGLSASSPRRDVEWRIESGMWVTGDLSLIEDLLFRLLDNAWKFTSIRERGIIEFGRETGTADGSYFLRDNGIGFDPSFTEAIFGAYQRTGAAANLEGAGLGLPIARIIVKRHGGRISAESRPGEGTTIHFSLNAS